MAINFRPPSVTGRTPEAQIAQLETWAQNLTDQLNYELNHIRKDMLIDGPDEEDTNG